MSKPTKRTRGGNGPREVTYWNGERTPARRVIVRLPAELGPDDPPQAWYRGLEGTTRWAVEVTYYGQVFLLDDDAHQGETVDLTGFEYRGGVPYLDGEPFQGGPNDLPKRHVVSEPGSGWAKVTVGHGSPRYGHRSLPVDCEVLGLRRYRIEWRVVTVAADETEDRR